MKKLIALCIIFAGCNNITPPVSNSGVSQASVKIETESNGLTVEQNNISNRLKMDNRPGSIKHLYLLSPFNGRQIFYSTVKGKVSSSGKRLTPKSVTHVLNGINESNDGITVQISGRTAATSEVIQDDGTYGDSSEYLYFWNETDQYFQLYVGGLTVVISDKPTSFQDVVIRNEDEK